MEVFEEKTRADRQLSSASSRFRRNSKIKYILTMAGIVLFTLFLLVVIHVSREYSFWSSENTQIQSEISVSEKLESKACDVPFCSTKECVFIASEMIESMNLDADPCTDFYDYACGGYSKTKAVPYGSGSISPEREAQQKLLIDIRKLMEKPLTGSDGQTVTKMRKVYDTCMNASHRDETENRTLSFWFSYLKLVPPNYALGDPFDFDITPWTELVTNLEHYDIHTLFQPAFAKDEHTPPDVLVVDCRVPFLNPDAYFNTTDDELAFQLVMYKEAMNTALELLHMDRDARHEFVDDVMKVDMDVARVALLENNPKKRLSYEHRQIFRNIWRPVVGDDVEDMSVMSACKYDMESILTTFSQAPNKRVVKYVMWQFLMQTMQYMGTKFRDIYLHYMTKLPGHDYAYEPKWKECTDVVRTDLGLVATKGLFEHGFIQEETINAVNAEFVEMKRNFALIFSSLLETVDRTFAEKFLDKVKKMKLTHGYSDILNNSTVLDSVYNDMDIGDDYFTNVLEIKRFTARRKFSSLWNRIGEDVLKDNHVDIAHSPLQISSHYDYLTNIIRVDLGLLRPPVLVHSEELPGYLTYGFASTVAREMVSAFDTTGSCYDADGTSYEKIWWPSVVENKYEDFISCIKDQVTRLHINDIPHSKVNSTKLVNVIMAEMGSFFIPYEGLKSHLKSQMDEKPLPGVPLNKKQTFFVQTAQILCEIRNKASWPEEFLQYLLPNKFRVNVAVSNMEDFGSIFNCPSDSAMNLERKCNLFTTLQSDR